MQTRVMYDSTMFSNASDQNLHTMAHYAYSVLGNTSYCSIVLRVVLVCHTCYEYAFLCSVPGTLYSTSRVLSKYNAVLVLQVVLACV